MLYILETNVSDKLSVFIALTKIYGIGSSKGELICKKLGFVPNLKIKNLSQKQIVALLQLINLLNFIINIKLKNLKSLFLKHLILNRSLRGLRIIKGLPVRGQRTRTNAKSAKKNILTNKIIYG